MPLFSAPFPYRRSDDDNDGDAGSGGDGGDAASGHRTPARKKRQSRWRVPVACGLGACAAFVVKSVFGNIHATALAQHWIALGGSIVFVVLAIIAVRGLADAVSSLISDRAGRRAATGTRIVTTATGYVIILFVTLGMLGVSAQHLLVGGAITGVVVGIAAQQSLGNVFAGMVLLLARPFAVGDRVRVRSGTLGGIFEGVVVDMSLTYVTFQTDEGVVHVPNTTLLAGAVGPAAQGN